MATGLVALLEWASKRFTRSLGVLALVGVAGRIARRMAEGTAHYANEGYGFFFELASNIAAGHGYSLAQGKITAFRVPGYPLYLLAVTQGDWQPWAIIVSQALIGGLTVAATGLIARRRFGRRAGLIAATICALWPYYLWHDTALQETALYTAVTAWAMFGLLRLDSRGGIALAILTGALLGFGVLVRETLWPFALGACLWALWRQSQQHGTRQGLLAGLSMLTAFGLVLSPWLSHTRQQYGKPVLGTEFGAALYAANHPALFTHFPDRSIDLSRAVALEQPLRELAALSPLERDMVMRQRGIDEIISAPVSFAGRFVRKIWIAFRPFPSPRHPGLADWLYALSWIPLLGLGLAGLWRERGNWRADLPFYLQFATFMVITGTLWAHTAHRVFLDLYLMVFAAGFAVQWMGRPRRSHRRNGSAAGSPPSARRARDESWAGS